MLIFDASRFRSRANMTKIGINASFLRKENTGIGQVTLNFLRKLSESQVTPKSSATGQVSHKSQVLEFVLYLEEDIELNLPKNFTKKFFLPKVYKRDDLIRKVWWEKYLLPRMAKKDGCDIFLSLYQSSTVIPKDIYHIMLVHDIIPELFPKYLDNGRKKLHWIFIKLAIKKATKIISISKRTEKDLIEHLKIDPRKITVSYIATDEIYKKDVSEKKSDEVLKKYGLEKGYIYSGGGMEFRKNIENTIRAYKVIQDENHDMFAKIKNIPPLVISGKLMPELAPLITDARALVDSMGLEKKVKLLDFVPQEDLPALYKNALMFSFPSFYEGFGLPVLEAMSQGTPVLTSKRSSLPEVGADAVLYCEPDDINDIALVMKNILTREETRKTLSEKSLKRSMNFSWEKFTEKMMNIISDTNNTNNMKNSRNDTKKRASEEISEK